VELQTLLAQARDVVTVRQVYGEPIERDGATIIPVAKVFGGGGGGSGSEPGKAGDDGSTGQAGASGSGGGFGFRAVPAGVYVVKDGAVSWQPALDLNRVILGGQLVAVVLFLVIRSIVGVLARRREPDQA
jgi:uncharacterized spore protein YtfJ